MRAQKGGVRVRMRAKKGGSQSENESTEEEGVNGDIERGSCIEERGGGGIKETKREVRDY